MTRVRAVAGAAVPATGLAVNETTATSDGKGIDRHESSRIVDAYLDAIDVCGLEVTD